jgi:demethylmenaquinone methyltransferase / 2-methoxy-6-polyprenyl-1,4-benzoquinol methylase
MVKEIFSTITARYDFLNHFLSLRRDIAWRRFSVKKMRFFETNRLLDVACGTGDLSLEAAWKHPGITVVGVDFVPEMVKAGHKKIAKARLSPRIGLLQGDAIHLPFPDNTFDVTAMAFGIRNIPDREGALREMARVAAPGGQVMILEMTLVHNRFVEVAYHVYLNSILSRIAGVFAFNPAAYRYLADSIMNFPSPGVFARTMEASGIEKVKSFSLTLGITNLHVGTKLETIPMDAA